MFLNLTFRFQIFIIDNVIQITIQGLHDENYSSAVVKNIGLPRKMRHGMYSLNAKQCTSNSTSSNTLDNF